MEYVTEKTKTKAGVRTWPTNDDVSKCFQTIIKELEAPKTEKMVDGYASLPISGGRLGSLIILEYAIL